jgi:hypothetical protein
MSTFWRYVRVQAFVFLCGIVAATIFLVVYFAAQRTDAEVDVLGGVVRHGDRRADRAGIDQAATNAAKGRKR